MSDREEIYKRESESETVRVRKTSNGDIVIDSYFGDVRDPKNHDRLTLNVTTGEISGHDFDHKDSFSSEKDKEKTK